MIIEEASKFVLEVIDEGAAEVIPSFDRSVVSVDVHTRGADAFRAEDEDALTDERALLASRSVPGIAGVGAGGVIVARSDDRPRLFVRDGEVLVGGRGTAHLGSSQSGENVEVEEFSGGG